MVTINSSTLRANVYETVYDTLNSANLLSSTVSVKGGYPEEDATYPLVVVNPVNVEEDEYTFTRAYGRKTVSIIIEIYATKNKQIDQITDEIETAIKNMSSQGITLIAWNEGNEITIPNNNKIHTKSILLRFRR